MQWLVDMLMKLFGGRQMAPIEPPKPEEPVKGEPEWLRIAKLDLGLREVAGPASNPEIMRYWSACDYDPHPDDSKDAWCSAAANYWVQKSGLPGTRAPNARSWLKWGHELKAPKPGAITVFWRESPSSWKGHVAIYLGPGKKPGTVSVLGGNQKDGVSIEDYSEKQVLSYRWPTTGGNSRTLKAQTAGMVGDTLTATGTVGAAMDAPGIIGSLPDALAIATAFQSLATYWPWFMVIGITISILARIATIWARLSDWQSKGV
jgi:uncharacterized protein (TIGR02594 family)